MQESQDNRLSVDTNHLPLAYDLWEITVPSAEDELSFGSPEAAGIPIARWELDLPADAGAATEILQQRESMIAASLSALQTAPDDIREFVHNIGGGRLDEVAFDTLPAQPLSSAEQEALRLLTYLEVGPENVSFASAEESRTDLDQASQQFQAAVERMLQLVSHFAFVETKIDGNLTGRTVVSWSGDMYNAWQEQVEADSYGLHQQSVRQAMASRNILIHACIATTQSAARLAVLLTNPAGAILALPVAWKLVNQILKDVEKYREMIK
jgi:hypothetical protein